jgi:glycosyltransferase involved in cell wall biosynthesis
VHQANQGVGGALNAGLAHCHSEFLARLDADDAALPTRLAKQVAFLRANPQVGLVGTQIAPLGSSRLGRTLSFPLDHKSIFAALMRCGRDGFGVCHSSVMVRTKLLKEVGGYWTLPVAEDNDMYLRIADRAELANLSELLLHFRVLSSGLTNRNIEMSRAGAAYASELALRRRRHSAPITFEEFLELRRARPWWTRLDQTLDAYALGQYRRATIETLGDRPMIGYARLAWAATCSPQRTWRRVCRVIRNRRPSGRTVPPVHEILRETERSAAT